LLKVREDFLGCGTFKIKDGSQTRFREDIWIGSKSLKEQFTVLYNIACDPHTTIKDVMNQVPLNICFTRALVQYKLTTWYNFLEKIASY
jgi:hypothetical protein